MKRWKNLGADGVVKVWWGTKEDSVDSVAINRYGMNDRGHLWGRKTPAEHRRALIHGQGGRYGDRVMVTAVKKNGPSNVMTLMLL